MNKLALKKLIMRRTYRSVMNRLYQNKAGYDLMSSVVDNLKEPGKEWNRVMGSAERSVLKSMISGQLVPSGFIGFIQNCFTRYLNKYEGHDISLNDLLPLHHEVIEYLEKKGCHSGFQIQDNSG